MKLLSSPLFVITLLGSITNLFGQGSLTPPGAPAPTMKSLDQIEPRIAISSLPYFINNPGSYYFTTNLSGNSGVTIGTGNVTLDLNGFTLQAVGGSGNGVFIAGNFTNIIIRNGVITGWSQRGVDGYTGSPRNTLYENLTVSANGSQGIGADNDSIIRNCRSYGNGFTSTQVGLYSHGGQIVDSIARGNASTGIFIYNGIIRNCLSETNNGSGIECNAGTVCDSASFNNLFYGIALEGGASARQCHVQGNVNTGIYTYNFAPLLGGVIADCVITTNLYGILLNGPGYLVTGNEIAYNKSAAILIQSSNSRIDGNHLAMSAGSYGMQLTSSTSYTNNVIVRNSAFGGGSSTVNYNISGTSNDVGPIGNASTNTSPWANISH